MALPISRHSLGVSAVATVADDGKVGNVGPLRTYRAAPLGPLVVTSDIRHQTSSLQVFIPLLRAAGVGVVALA